MVKKIVKHSEEFTEIRRSARVIAQPKEVIVGLNPADESMVDKYIKEGNIVYLRVGDTSTALSLADAVQIRDKLSKVISYLQNQLEVIVAEELKEAVADAIKRIGPSLVKGIMAGMYDYDDDDDED